MTNIPKTPAEGAAMDKIPTAMDAEVQSDITMTGIRMGRDAKNAEDCVAKMKRAREEGTKEVWCSSISAAFRGFLQQKGYAVKDTSSGHVAVTWNSSK